MKKYLALGLLLVTAAGFFHLHRPGEQPILPVAGYHYYLARQIYRGDVLYRDMFIDKPPLTETIGAGCFLACSGDLFSSVILTRWVFFCFYLFSAVPLFLLSRRLFRRELPAFLVALTYLSFNFPYEKLVVSADWHVPMVFFGLLSLVLFLRGMGFASGLAASLSTLFWQPGLIFLIAIFLSLALTARPGRRKSAVRIAAGFLIPIGLVLLHAGIRGSLSELVEQVILSGRQNIGSEFLYGVRVLPRRIVESYSGSIPIIILGLAGYCLGWRAIRRGGLSASRQIIPLSLLTMMIFIDLVDMPSSRHVIPALPWISFYAVFLVERLAGPREGILRPAVRYLVLAGLIACSLKGTLARRPGPGALERQRREYLDLLERNGYRPGDTIFCMESVLPALFAGLKNPGRHVYCLEDKHYRFIERYEEGGFESITRLIEEADPRLVCIGNCSWSRREWPRETYDPLREFLGRRYELVEDKRMWLYRKPRGAVD